MADPGPHLNQQLVPIAHTLTRTLSAEAVFVVVIHQAGDTSVVSCGASVGVGVSGVAMVGQAAEYLAEIAADIEAGLPWTSDDPRVTG